MVSTRCITRPTDATRPLSGRETISPIGRITRGRRRRQLTAESPSLFRTSEMRRSRLLYELHERLRTVTPLRVSRSRLTDGYCVTLDRSESIVTTISLARARLRSVSGLQDTFIVTNGLDRDISFTAPQPHGHPLMRRIHTPNLQAILAAPLYEELALACDRADDTSYMIDEPALQQMNLKC